jgi:hypothetical protein
LKGWLVAGLAIGVAALAYMHEPDLIQHIAGRPLPPKKDFSTRARGYHEMAVTVEAARENLMKDGKPVFIIGGHYGTTGHLSFYIPEARTNVADHPVVFYQTSTNAINQFYFWPGYVGNRTGDNAIYVREMATPPLKKGTLRHFFMDGWLGLWLKGEPMEDLVQNEPEAKGTPKLLTEEFESVKDLGVFPIYYHGRVFHTIQLFECRNLH